MLIPCPVHFFPTLPFRCACLNICGVINVIDAPVSHKKRCLCVLPKLRYAHDRSAEMVGSIMFVFIFATILLPNDLLSNVVENAATLNSLEPPYVWENGSSAVTIVRWQNPPSCPSSAVRFSVLGVIHWLPCALLSPCKFGVRRVWHSDLPVAKSPLGCGFCGRTVPGVSRTMPMMECCRWVIECCTSIVRPCDQSAHSRCVICIFCTLVDFVASVFRSVLHFLFWSSAGSRSPSSAVLFPL
jgi:hypothetical protein